MRVLTALALAAGLASQPSAQIRGKTIGVDDDPVLGSASAKVTIIEFGDYQCPACRYFWREVEPRIRKEYIDTGKVRLVFRDLPIVEIHPEAKIAALAAQCANEQGKYWQYHDKVFREQDRREDVMRFKAADLKKWAADIGIVPAAFNECLDSARYKTEVERDYAEGISVGIQGTPTFFVNGQVIPGPESFILFKRVIDEELKR